MKRSLATILLVMLCIGVTFAANYPIDFNNSDKGALPLPKLIPDNYNLNDFKVSEDQTLGYKSVVRNVGTRAILGQFSYAMNNVKPFQYEPNSGTLLFIVPTYATNTAQNKLEGFLHMFYSKNGGDTWQNFQIFDQVGIVPVHPSFSVLNNGNATDPTNFNYLVTYPYAKEQSGSYPWGGGMFLIVNGTSIDNVTQAGPISKQKWWSVEAASQVKKISNVDHELFYNAGLLSSDPNELYGYYGFSSFDMTDGSFVTQSVPSIFNISNFRSAPAGSSYNNPMHIGTDNNGAVYALVNNMFVDNENQRIPAVSKSTDMGVTWSTWNRFPQTMLENYILNEGGVTSKSGIFAYEKDGFTVVGPDEMSYLFRMIIMNDQNQYGIQIVEVVKKDDSWQIRKVADVVGTPRIILDERASTTDPLKDSLQWARNANEIEVAKTADGKYLVAKWIDYNGKLIVVSPAITISNGEQTIDTLLSNDVYMTYRGIGETSWHDTINVTKDDMINKMSFLPNIVPSINKVPVLTCQTIKSSDATNPRNNYPAPVLQLVSDFLQEVMVTTADLTVTSVKENPVITNFKVSEIYPNPATDQIDMAYNLDENSNVRIEIYDIMGQKVKTVLDSYIAAKSDRSHVVL